MSAPARHQTTLDAVFGVGCDLLSVDGTAFAPQGDTTCKAWTSSGEGSAIVGHHDRIGPLPENWAKSWNFSHPSAGCSQEALVRTGGAGRFYCFASN